MGIHDTIPESAMEKKQDKRLIEKGILKNLKFGRENAIKSHELAKIIGVEVTATNQQIRTICKKLLVDQGIPILSCPAGFFKANSSVEIENYLSNLESRIKGMERDMLALIKIKKEFFDGKR